MKIIIVLGIISLILLVGCADNDEETRGVNQSVYKEHFRWGGVKSIMESVDMINLDNCDILRNVTMKKQDLESYLNKTHDNWSPEKVDCYYCTEDNCLLIEKEGRITICNFYQIT